MGKIIVSLPHRVAVLTKRKNVYEAYGRVSGPEKALKKCELLLVLLALASHQPRCESQFHLKQVADPLSFRFRCL